MESSKEYKQNQSKVIDAKTVERSTQDSAPRKKALIMAGGTGGHVFPALATARVLSEQGVDVQWLGTRRGIESELVPASGIPIHYMKVEGLRGKGIKQLLLAPFKLVYALIQALRIVGQYKPDVVLGMGGFASGPGGLAAWLLGRPIVIHEQNAVAGTTNRILSKLSSNVLSAFPNAFGKKNQSRVVGNPVREDITALNPPKERWNEREGPTRVLVLGGSQGAVAINQWVPSFIKTLDKKDRPLIWHQAGKRNIEDARNLYRSLDVEARVDPFIKDMAEAYAWADFVICRSGALTVSELMSAGVGAMLIPLPFAIDDHQTANGRFMEEGGGAIVVPQKDLNLAEVHSALTDLLTDRVKLLDMAESARKLALQNSAESVADVCIKSK